MVNGLAESRTVPSPSHGGFHCRQGLKSLPLCPALGILCPTAAHATMTGMSLEELAAARLEVISFFIAVFVLCALVVRWAWNALADDFPKLPQIHFKHALCLMLISGLLLYVVLTMVSGARELMTPGAWRRAGVTYELASPQRDPQLWVGAARREALARLHQELATYAGSHDGKFPSNREMSGIAPEAWAGIHPKGIPFSYVGWLATHSVPSRVLAYESEDYGSEVNVLLVDGTVINLERSKLVARLRAELDAVTPKLP